MYAIRNRTDPTIYFHHEANTRATDIDRFRPGQVPRLFARRRDAKYALDQWLSGRIQKIERPDLDCGYEMRLQRQPDRRRDHWEIVEILVVTPEELIGKRIGR